MSEYEEFKEEGAENPIATLNCDFSPKLVGEKHRPLRTNSTKSKYIDVEKLDLVDFAGWGESNEMVADPEQLNKLNEVKRHEKLGQWSATAISGNDILSSCLYASGLTALAAGKYAPFALILVALVLYFYKFMYGEVVTALPKNGGVFNALIHTTSKGNAAFASCLSILSYVATGVVSAASACRYLIYLKSNITGVEAEDNIVIYTVILLFVFAFLCFMGLRESATVALFIFILHVLSLICLIIVCFVYACKDNWNTLIQNWKMDPHPVNIGGTDYMSVIAFIFMGFSSAILGVSGFETSSQYVEEQAPGVFRKTLSNMLWSVAFFNPTISLLSFAVLPYEDQYFDKTNQTVLLSAMAKKAAGQWFLIVISLDAFIVLSGAVLTAYVGVTGLIRQIASDRCLPQFLLAENKWRGTNHIIIFGFFVLSSSLLIVLGGDETTLAGVYTLSFLGVMCLFGFACLLLKVKRPDIHREEVAPWWAILFGISGVLIAIVGNILGNANILFNFIAYFCGIGLLMSIMYQRLRFLRLLGKLFVHCPCYGSKLVKMIEKLIVKINSRTIVFFCKTNDLSVMNKAVLYVRDNEQTKLLTFVHVIETDDLKPTYAKNRDEDNDSDDIEYDCKMFHENVALLDNMYPKIRLNSLIVKGGRFNRAMVEYMSEVLGTPQNYMFIAQPKIKDLEGLGSVRVITH